MAKTGKPLMVTAAAFIAALALTGLGPTATMGQIPFPMIPNLNGGPQHYPSGSPHHSTRNHSRHDEDKTSDKAKEKEATQPEPTASTSAQRQPQTTSAPSSQDSSPSGGPNTPASLPPPAKKTNDDQPTFQPSR